MLILIDLESPRRHACEYVLEVVSRIELVRGICPACTWCNPMGCRLGLNKKRESKQLVDPCFFHHEELYPQTNKSFLLGVTFSFSYFITVKAKVSNTTAMDFNPKNETDSSKSINFKDT